MKKLYSDIRSKDFPEKTQKLINRLNFLNLQK